MPLKVTCVLITGSEIPVECVLFGRHNATSFNYREEMGGELCSSTIVPKAFRSVRS